MDWRVFQWGTKTNLWFQDSFSRSVCPRYMQDFTVPLGAVERKGLLKRQIVKLKEMKVCSFRGASIGSFGEFRLFSSKVGGTYELCLFPLYNSNLVIRTF